MNWQQYKDKILSEINIQDFYLNEFPNCVPDGEEMRVPCMDAADRHLGGKDNNPSMTINMTTGIFWCSVCHSKGNIHTFMKKKYNMTSDAAWKLMGDSLNLERPEGAEQARPDIDINLVATWHKALMTNDGPIRDVIQNRRGLTDKTLNKFQLGWDGSRITIPIYDEYANLVNIRKYKWDAPDEAGTKVINHTDEFGNAYGELRIFGIDKVMDKSIDTILWTEGETDRMLAEQHGFHAACPTSGAGTFKAEWIKLFQNKKRIVLAMDNDDAGWNAIKELTNLLDNTCEVVYITWPSDFPKKGDITDYLTGYGGTPNGFAGLIAEAKVYSAQDEAADAEVPNVHLSRATDARYANSRIKVAAMVSGKFNQPYIMPTVVTFECGSACDPTDAKCMFCSVKDRAGAYTQNIPLTDEVILSLVKVPKNIQEKSLKNRFGVNSKCKAVKLSLDKMVNLEECQVIPKAEQTTDNAVDSEYVSRSCYIVNQRCSANCKYTMYGSLQANPSTQESMLLFDKLVPEKDVVSGFELDDDIKALLNIFKVDKDSKLVDKIMHIHNDLERNVTNVWGRRDVGIAVDMVYNSVLSFYFQGTYIKRGWAELQIIGDSGQAKSTLVQKIMQHYKQGEFISGESTRRTGLTHGLSQVGSRWMLTWGALPLNDGGLLCVDELSGMSTDDLSQLSEVRTSGIARVNGVITSETNARTRAIYIANPRSGKRLRAEAFGVEAIKKLWGKAEDVRRLDLAIGVASGDVDEAEVNRPINTRPRVKHEYTSEACNARTRWIWSRTPDQIKFTDAASTLILKAATEMGRKYSSNVPLVEGADQRLKLARLAIAVAGTVVSTDDTYEKIVVTDEHVAFVIQFLNKIYSQPALNYAKFSAQEMETSDDSLENLDSLRASFSLLDVTDINELADTLYHLPYLDRNTLADYTGLMPQELLSVLKFITTNKLVESFKGRYRRTTLGTALFERICDKRITRIEIAKNRQEAAKQYTINDDKF